VCVCVSVFVSLCVVVCVCFYTCVCLCYSDGKLSGTGPKKGECVDGEVITRDRPGGQLQPEHRT